MADISLSWGANTELLWSAASFPVSLANAANSASSDTLDVAALNPVIDVLITMKMRTPTLATNGSVYLYALSSLDNSNFTNNFTGEAVLIGAMTLNAINNSEYSAAFSVARAFGGAIPPYLKFFVRNETGGTLSATLGHSQVFYAKVKGTAN
jgi:hypothetical protein